MGFGALLAVARGVPCVARAFLFKLALLRSEGSCAAAPRRPPVSAGVLTASSESFAHAAAGVGAWRTMQLQGAKYNPRLGAADIIAERARKNIASVGLQRVRTTPQTTPEQQKVGRIEQNQQHTTP